jgi:uncharacterized protein (TIGR03067 family)
MRHPLARLILPALLLSPPATAADGPPKPDDAAIRKQLVGVWKGFTVNGKGENPNAGPVKLELTITETTIHGLEIKPGGNNVDHGAGEFTLDLSPDPDHLDAAHTNERGRKRAYVGIYTLDGDTLKWCVSPQKTRPTTFETAKGQFLLVLRREPAKQP